eukprot:472788_1
MSTNDSLTIIEKIIFLTGFMAGAYTGYLTHDEYMSMAVGLTAIMMMIILYHGGPIRIGAIILPILIIYMCLVPTANFANWIMFTYCSNLFWVIISIVAVFIVFVLLSIVAILIILIITFVTEKPITRHTCAPIERYTYGHLYKNNPIPSHIYQLNYQHENIWNCNLCDKPFHSNTSQVIITCGHRFHAECLRKEELDHFTHSPSLHITHRCPRLSGCNTEYNWRQKWNYTHINKDCFMQIRDETLLKVLPDAIEDIVLQFIN